MCMFGIVGGVLADTLDRRRLLMAVQGGLVVATSALAALTIAGRMSPALLLMFTFVIGTGSVFVTPAYQSLVPELVPHDADPCSRTAQLHQRQPRQGDRAGDRRDPDRVHRGRGGLRRRCRDVPLLRRRGRSLAAEPGHDPADPRAIRVGTAGRRPIRPLRAGRPPDFAPGRALSRPGERALGAAPPRREPPPRTRVRRVRAAARCPRGRGHRRGLRAIESTRPPVDERPHRTGRRGVCRRSRRGDPGAVDRCGRHRPASRRHGVGRNACDGQHVAAALLAALGQGARVVRLPDGALRRARPRGRRLGCGRRLVWTHRSPSSSPPG